VTGEDDVTYQLYLGGEIDDEIAGELITQMAEFDEQDPTAYWNVIINSGGGDTEAGSAVAMTLRSHSERGGGNHFITTIATGRCASMATLVMQAGDHRVTDELCWWMFHEPSTVCSTEQSLTNAARDAQMLKRWNDVADTILLERTTLTIQQYRRMIKGHNLFLMGTELFDMGFVDEVR